MKIPTVSLSRTQILALSALWISLLPNLATLQKFATSPSAGEGSAWLLFVATGWFATFSVVLFFLALFGLLFPGRSIKLWCVIAVVVAAVLSYFSWFLGTYFDKSMFANMLGTHPAETRELISVRLLAWTFFVGIVPSILLLLIKLKAGVSWLGESGRSAAILLLPLLATLALVYAQMNSFASAGRNKSITFHTLAPVNLVAASVSHYVSIHRAATKREAIGLDATLRHTEELPRLIVFVLGETARAQNQQLNGYARETNKRMIEERVVNFPYVQSCGTATAFSVPCMFSGFTREEFSLSAAQSRETLLDVISRGGGKVLWIDNDGGCKGVCDRIETIDLTASTDPKFCPEPGVCYDDILLDAFQKRVPALKGDTLVVLHLKGSHGPAYYKRYPAQFEKYTPACKTNELSSCSLEQIRNAYDNTLVYTDHILGEVVQILKGQQDRFGTIMFYVSDHGESLGERGLYLHGLPYALAPEEQTRVPMFAWFSPKFLKMEHWPEACVRRQSLPGLSHDYVYSTMLGLHEIDTHLYRPERDIFLVCDREADVIEEAEEKQKLLNAKPQR
jgi:lipid A ethanolaminephosphotransferase